MPPNEAQKANPETAIAVMSRDIHYMKQSLERIEKSFGEAVKNNVTRTEFDAYRIATENAQKERDQDLVNYKLAQDIICRDVETRMRVQEATTTKTRTELRIYIAIVGVIFTVVQIVIGIAFN